MKNDPRSYDRNFCNCVKKPEKNSGLQRGLNTNTHFKGTSVSQLTINRKSVFWHSQITLAERK